MPDRPANIGASVRARLLNLARERGTDFQLILTRYVLERLLYRLSVSAYREKFILKGAMLNALWLEDPFRATRDLDLLGSIEADADEARATFRAILATPVADDGVAFDAEHLTAEAIRENASYGGIRLTTTAQLGGARVPVRIDIGFGDAVTPGPVLADYPALLDLPRPRLRIYPRETVVAEKCEAMVSLGLTNSRLKDFYDVAVLATTFAFEGPQLGEALAATFRRRGTPLPREMPPALTDAFVRRPETLAQWRAFTLREAITEALNDLDHVAALLRVFLVPPLEAAANGVAFDQEWPSGGPWRIQTDGGDVTG
ncbi:MAG: nucleotidyl transferase AbiEii/AbiGii toxin family protein [Alphaproteobacteria bacterium]|nr:nucleotidyl transferase AbiEii/AbiGii toxin family protein [Alphaproteobacteria bacterium]